MDEKLALVCAGLSQEVYGDVAMAGFKEFPDIKVAFFESEDSRITDTQVAVFQNLESKEIYIVFRGSDKGVDWMNNFQMRQQIYPYGDPDETDVRFHNGFMTAYRSVRDRVLAEVRKYPDFDITVTGHSLGGAVATIAALDVQYNITQHTGQSIQVYSFGAPRVGNSALVESFQRRVPKNYRFVYGWDIVTYIPRVWQGYEHVPEEYRLGSRWTWRVISRRFDDHKIANYIKALAAKIGMTLT